MSRNLFFGWRVVAVAFLVAVFAWGIGFYGPSIYMQVLHVARGWSVSVISAAVTTHFLTSALIVAHLSEIHGRFGIAATTRAGIVALGVGVIGWALAAAPWQLFAAAVITGAGFAVTSGAAINAMVQPWFVRRRAAALSLALNGASVGGIVFAPLWIWLIGRLGFPAAATGVAVSLLAVLWPLVGRYVGPGPRELRLWPDGESASTTTIVSSGTERSTKSPPLNRARLLRDRRFVTMSASSAFGLFAQVGLLVHLVSLLAPALGQVSAAAAVSLTTACAIAGRLLLGAFIGTADRRIVSAANTLIQACGTVLLIITGAPVMLLLGCALFGLGVGNLIVIPPLIAQSEFYPADVSRVVALTTAINQALFALAPATFGVLEDLTRSYSASLVLAMAMQVASSAVVLAGRGGCVSPERLTRAAGASRSRT